MLVTRPDKEICARNLRSLEAVFIACDFPQSSYESMSFRQGSKHLCRQGRRLSQLLCTHECNFAGLVNFHSEIDYQGFERLVFQHPERSLHKFGSPVKFQQISSRPQRSLALFLKTTMPPRQVPTMKSRIAIDGMSEQLIPVETRQTQRVWPISSHFSTQAQHMSLPAVPIVAGTRPEQHRSPRTLCSRRASDL